MLPSVFALVHAAKEIALARFGLINCPGRLVRRVRPIASAPDLTPDLGYVGELKVCVLILAVSGDRSYEDTAVIRKRTNEIHWIRREGGAAVH
jgi:hypothetical protein